MGPDLGACACPYGSPDIWRSSGPWSGCLRLLESIARGCPRLPRPPDPSVSPVSLRLLGHCSCPYALGVTVARIASMPLRVRHALMAWIRCTRVRARSSRTCHVPMAWIRCSPRACSCCPHPLHTWPHTRIRPECGIGPPGWMSQGIWASDPSLRGPGQRWAGLPSVSRLLHMAPPVRFVDRLASRPWARGVWHVVCLTCRRNVALMYLRRFSSHDRRFAAWAAAL